MVDDRNEEVGYKEAEAAHFEECTHSNVDGEARWLKKGGQSHYGCKRHTATDENGLILAEVTTPANQSDIKNLNSSLDKLDLPQDTLVLTDKGYRSAENEAYLKGRKLRSGLMHRAQKDKPLTSSEKTLNRLISSSRYVVERTFGSIKRWFSGGTARYVGLSKMHMQHTLEAIAYNLYRSPGIIVSDFLPIALKLQKRENLICLQKACS